MIRFSTVLLAASALFLASCACKTKDCATCDASAKAACCSKDGKACCKTGAHKH